MRFDKLDLYVTAFLGYNSMQAVYDKNNIYRDSLNHRVDAFSAGPIIGAKFYFNRHLGIYAEAGLARVAFIGAGLTWNIRTN